MPRPSASGKTPANVTSLRSRGLLVVADATSQLPIKWTTGDMAYFIARAMLFHQASCKFGERSGEFACWRFSPSACRRRPCRFAPPARPSVWRVPRLSPRRAALQLMTMRDCVSPNSSASNRWGEAPDEPSSACPSDREDARPTDDKSIVAPISRGVSRATSWLMQLSARHTARPPSLQSCALFTTAGLNQAEQRRVQGSSPVSRSQRGGVPVFFP